MVSILKVQLMQCFAHASSEDFDDSCLHVTYNNAWIIHMIKSTWC